MLLSRQILGSLAGFSSHISRRSAGHSKWANIKHTKAAKDMERSLLFVRLCQKIKVAIQEGGSANPDLNLFLAQAISIAKNKCMPVTSIQNCIKTAQANANAQKISWYEIKGPRGCYIIAQALTDTPKRTRDTISSILRRNGAMFAESSAKSLFDHKGIIVATSNDKGDVDKAVDDAIECGAEEVVPEEADNHMKFICEMQDLKIIKTKLESRNYTIVSTEIDLIPKMKVEISEDDLPGISKLFDKLEELPEIVKLYDNIA